MKEFLPIKKKLYEHCIREGISYRDTAALFNEDENVLWVFAEKYFYENGKGLDLHDFYNKFPKPWGKTHPLTNNLTMFDYYMDLESNRVLSYNKNFWR